MRKHHNGYEIEVRREMSLGGDELVYITAFRESDGLEVINEITDAEDYVRDIMRDIVARIDEFIRTGGASEFLDDAFTEGSTGA